ncbi:DUF1642 domain-containing protein [Listeria seeligeri]|uniref:DUF1642 domain-containing protein n=1 Tax=Listeria seeligeri TaxID=1640 RepID=UPI001624EFD3|nr:DUF1642 domain-containing protein [Listeria seeligeri]MBC1850224.1 DUF1642 domain-containing protein [Listeria seeligeri]MBC1850298.1 DUF1642 domain-containing protein [Listeria seeligeri]MBF2533491.1 DUF1642 domain-containing protein [Listeria seeligeri]
MKFKKGDRVQFISESSLAEGVIWEVKASNHGISYKVESDHEKNRWMWIDEGHLIPLTPLPVIPQFVADWIFEHKAFERDLLSTLDIENPAMPKSVSRWLVDNVDNQELFARAWIDGYEVEQEPLYYVQFPIFRLNTLGTAVEGDYKYLWADPATGESGIFQSLEYPATLIKSGWKTKFTEEQLKDINEKYWAFAVPVEEVEE